MNIHELHIHHFRNLHRVMLHFASCNVFIGHNGSGKTSLLESIYLLSRGKSFRHHQPKHYIEHGYQTTTVFARLSDTLTDDKSNEQIVAIEKALDASTQLRHNGQTLLTQSPLAQLLPTLLLEPISLTNLEQGSQVRRELLDWLLFHVEQNFHREWLAYQRLLKQRNTLLKQVSHIDQLSTWQRQELAAWDKQLSQHASHIHQQREAILTEWQPHFIHQVQAFLPQYAEQLRLRYSVGYDVNIGLETLLVERVASDVELGYTRMGSHRADINVMLDTQHIDEAGHSHKHTLAATDMLSRGEKKLLMTAFRLSQLPLLNARGKVPLVLIDDITAELDDRALSLLLKALKQVNSQLFITTLSTDILPMIKEIWQDDVKLFHVEHGKVSLANH